MRYHLILVSVVCLSIFGAKYGRGEDPQPPPGFTPLFNGKDLSGWHGMPHFDPYEINAIKVIKPEEYSAMIEKWTADCRKHWTVENGELVNDGHGAYLTTDREYGDIELLIEYKTVAKADSGIYLRATPQVQIWDYTKEGGKWDRGADKGSGGLWNNSPGAPGKDPFVLADKPFGEWNKFRILMVGERVTVYLNGKLVVDHARLENFWKREEVKRLENELKKLQVDGSAPVEKRKTAEQLAMRIEAVRTLPLSKQGVIQLQTHGGEIRWRNILVREIPSAQANELLRKHIDSLPLNKHTTSPPLNKGGQGGLVDIFNGKDFTGWAGAVQNYEIIDGTIVCKPKKGGNIFTEEQYTDFIARLEYKLPPGGNNGLAIRYPGKGQASVDAMCEIQILDDDAPKYAKLDPRQFNGSAYGMAAAHRGYLRPTGEWNFMEVTVRGPTIQVDLNGTRILDADLSKVADFKDGHPHPGKDRTAGHFGFCGHSDSVAFRNVQIRRLDPKESTSTPGAIFPMTSQLLRQPELPNPLLTLDGKRVANKDDWSAQRRPELRKLFEHYMYGRYPEVKTHIVGKVLHEDPHAFGGKATLREVQVNIGIEKSSPIYLLIATPNKRPGPVPAFLGMNFCGNHCLTSDPKVRVPTAWMYDRYPGVMNNRATEAGRGKQMDVWPLELAVERGYAVATFYSGDIEPDRNDVREGIAAPKGTPSPEHTGRIMAWAWGIHRALDYLTTLDALDAKRIAVVGHSRLGKTALLAAAFDERIALAIPHQAGCGGTAPNRCNNPKGETIKRINTSFPHWFCGRFKEFNDDPAKLPFDQHSLVALCAPRPVLFTNAVEDQWADPPGQFDVLKAASPVYEFLGVEGLKADKAPPLGQLVDSRLGYFIRPGPHSMTTEDWQVFLQFADKWLGK